MSLYLPKLRLAKVFGFKGTKAINMQVNFERKTQGLDPINLEEYFSEELDQRVKDQQDLLIELCKTDQIMQARQQHSNRMSKANSSFSSQFSGSFGQTGNQSN